MRGLWTEETMKLAMAVAQDNPGALRVIDELLYFTKWLDMMRWCEKHLRGADLWIKYKDKFNCDSNKLGEWIQVKMWEDNQAGIKPYMLKGIEFK